MGTIFHNDCLIAFGEMKKRKILDFTVTDYADLKWKTIDFKWDEPRTELSICSVSNENKLALLGGHNLDCYYKADVDLLDLHSNKIQKLSAMNYSRLDCGSLFDDAMSNRIIVCGGHGGASFETDPTNSSKSKEIYDFHKNEWTLNQKLTNYEHENCELFRDKANPNILMIAGNHCDPNFYERENDGFIEWTDLRDPFPKCKWSLLSEKSLIQLFNVSDDTIKSMKWQCDNLSAF